MTMLCAIASIVPEGFEVPVLDRHAASCAGHAGRRRMATYHRTMAEVASSTHPAPPGLVEWAMTTQVVVDRPATTKRMNAVTRPSRPVAWRTVGTLAAIAGGLAAVAGALAVVIWRRGQAAAA